MNDPLSDDPDTRQVQLHRLREFLINHVESVIFTAKADAEALSWAHNRLFVDLPSSPTATNQLAAAALRAQVAALEAIHRQVELLAAAGDDGLPDLADRFAAEFGDEVVPENRR